MKTESDYTETYHRVRRALSFVRQSTVEKIAIHAGTTKAAAAQNLDRLAVANLAQYMGGGEYRALERPLSFLPGEPQ